MSVRRKHLIEGNPHSHSLFVAGPPRYGDSGWFLDVDVGALDDQVKRSSVSIRVLSSETPLRMMLHKGVRSSGLQKVKGVTESPCL
jgi:hypothetical protein